jgi:hypothetical protein
MAAVMPFLEASPLEAEAAQADTALAETGRLGANYDVGREYVKKRGQDADRSLLPLLAKPHAELANLMWARAAILKHLSQNTITVERKPILSGVPAEKLQFGQPSEYYLRLGTPLPFDAVPWWGLSGDHDRKGASLFSTNSKMACPTFDLPAGSKTMQGTCPGAIAGQTVVPPAIREGAIDNIVKKTGHYNIEKAVCEYCYATGSKYAETSTQMKELIAFAFVSRMVQQNPTQLAQILYEGVLGAESFYSALDPTRRFGFLPVRVHSSGDFYSQSYAKVWIAVARKLLENEAAGGRAVRLWAPTRTHVVEGWDEFWATAKVPENFVIRPSGWHVDDAAPEAAGLAKGTSVIHKDIAPGLMGQKYDFQCQTYGLDAGKRTCAISNPPMTDENGNIVRNAKGGVSESTDCGCRACWLRPELRVNYAFH